MQIYHFYNMVNTCAILKARWFSSTFEHVIKTKGKIFASLGIKYLNPHFINRPNENC